ncbi:cytochrome P450 [Pisolithus marmoratus]|nr:cytochrome P450 [Pisolithus marmoratus]
MDRWMVVASGPRLLDELRKIPDDKLSFDHAVQDVVREHLRRNFEELFPSIFQEIRLTFDDLVPFQERGWVKVGAYSAAMKATCRASNRVFVGFPICMASPAEFEKIQSKFALQVATRAAIMNVFPKLLHPYVYLVLLSNAIMQTCPSGIIGRLLTNTAQQLKDTAWKCFGLVIDERLTKMELLGNGWSEKPVSSPEDRNLRSIAPAYSWFLNFASLHTSAQCIGPLREEVKGVVDQYGWTKDSMSRLPKMDSFLKESQRMSCTSLTPVIRKAMEDLTFSDGTRIPTGTHIAISPATMFLDDQYYQNPHEFDPLSLHFGQGKRAWY